VGGGRRRQYPAEYGRETVAQAIDPVTG